VYEAEFNADGLIGHLHFDPFAPLCGHNNGLPRIRPERLRGQAILIE